MAIHRDMFLSHLMLEYGRTRHYLGSFSDKDLDFRPAAGTRTVREWAIHLMGCHHYLLKAGVDDDFSNDNFKVRTDFQTVAGAVDLFDDHYRALRDGLRSLPDERFNRKIHVFGRETLFSDLALDILIHEAHHRGQLAIALRLLGIIPPDVYMQTPPLVE